MSQCCKYINKHGTTFIWCKELNSRPYRSSYLTVFTDKIDGYQSYYNYCPYCGQKLLVTDKRKQD